MNGHCIRKKSDITEATKSESEERIAPIFTLHPTYLPFGANFSLMHANPCLLLDLVAEFAFVEIAAEPNRSVLSGFKPPFKEIITYRWGDSEIPENAIVFSNEWLDAQPFKRFLFSAMEDRWMELGVREEKGHLKESPLSFTDSVTQSFPSLWKRLSR